MVKKIVLSFVVIVVLAAAAGAAYYYYYSTPVYKPTVYLPPAALPDNSIIAGPVVSITATSIVVKKQNGTTLKLDITPDTKILAAGTAGQAGTSKKASDIKAGDMVLVTPSSTSTTALSIVLIPPAAAQ